MICLILKNIFNFIESMNFYNPVKCHNKCMNKKKVKININSFQKNKMLILYFFNFYKGDLITCCCIKNGSCKVKCNVSKNMYKF